MVRATRVETFYGKHSDTVVYEYRGRKYEVEYAKDWSYMCSAARIQHREAQERIDEEIDHPKPEPKGGENAWDVFSRFYEEEWE